MSFSFLELSKFDNELNELKDGIDRWAYFFKHASHIDPYDLEKILKEDSALSNAYKALERVSYTPEQLLEYDRYAWKEEEIKTRINDARFVGEEKCIEKGRAEERAKAEAEKHAEKIKTAKKMLSKGLSISDIADFTGLSVEEVRSL